MSPAELWELAARWARTDGNGESDSCSKGVRSIRLRLASLVADSTKQAETIPYSTNGGGPSKIDTQPRLPSERPPSPSQPPGPRYKIGELLGAGGVGLVTSALDRTIGRSVAVKTLKLGKDSEVNVARRFIDEAHVTAQLEHPNITCPSTTWDGYPMASPITRCESSRSSRFETFFRAPNSKASGRWCACWEPSSR